MLVSFPKPKCLETKEGGTIFLSALLCWGRKHFLVKREAQHGQLSTTVVNPINTTPRNFSPSVIYLDYRLKKKKKEFQSALNGLENEKQPFGHLNRPKDYMLITTPIPHLPWLSGVSRFAMLARSPSLELLLWRQRHPTVQTAAAFPYAIRTYFRQTQNQTDFGLLQGSIFEDGIIICLGVIFLNNILFFSGND